jgi:hypothetical protein
MIHAYIFHVYIIHEGAQELRSAEAQKRSTFGWGIPPFGGIMSLPAKSIKAARQALKNLKRCAAPFSPNLKK